MEKDSDIQSLINRIISFREDQTRITEWIFRMLDALDNKTAALLQFNAIIIAIFAIFRGSNYLSKHLLVVLILLGLISCLLCLMVVYVKWPFLKNDVDVDDEIKDLTDSLCMRTRMYKCSWGISAFLIISLG